MRIFHALLGYLAVTALPFHLFAYPLAIIDYDGYVNTTQTHGDSPLMKRVLPGDTIDSEARQLGLPEFGAIFAVVAASVIAVAWLLADNPVRAAFTQTTISKIISEYPSWNWIICHSPYSVGFDGVEGTDWGYTHHELGISFGRTIGYDLYWARSGTFYRQGNGGFINWAYNGNILGTDDDGATVHFGTIS